MRSKDCLVCGGGSSVSTLKPAKFGFYCRDKGRERGGSRGRCVCRGVQRRFRWESRHDEEVGKQTFANLAAIAVRFGRAARRVAGHRHHEGSGKAAGVSLDQFIGFKAIGVVQERLTSLSTPATLSHSWCFSWRRPVSEFSQTSGRSV